MDIKQAYSELGVSEDIADDELKSAYKKLVRKYHPDVYKQDPDKLKKINEAYQLIQDYKENPHKYKSNPFGGGGGFNPFSDFGGFGFNMEDLFANQEPQRRYNFPPPSTKINLTFQESVLGCERELKYKIHQKCKKCDGNAEEKQGNGCTQCNGFGEIKSRKGQFQFRQTCNKCMGKNVKRIKCVECNGHGTFEEDVSGKVHVPPGVTDGNMLKLRGKGHFAGNMYGSSAYGDAVVLVNVGSHPTMKLDGTNVISNINISLLESLTGTSKNIETVKGNKEITLKSNIKNKEEVYINNCGVKNTNGKHIVIVNVDYPKDTEKLISFLKEQDN